MSGEVTLHEVADLPIFYEQQLDPTAIPMAAFTHKDPTARAACDAHWAKIRADPTVTLHTIVWNGGVAGSIASYGPVAEPEVTYWIGKEFWGKGPATVTLSQFLQAQTTRPIHGRAAKDNAASIRVMQKCGFSMIGSEKAFANARGEEIEEVALILRAA